MSRRDAIALAHRHYDDGGFLAVLREAVGLPTESQARARGRRSPPTSRSS